MKLSNSWKVFIVLFVVSWALYELTPPGNRDLIEVFQAEAEPAARDATFTNIVTRARELQAQFPDRAYQNLAQAVGTNDLTGYFPGYKIPPGEDPSRVILNKVQSAAAGEIKLGLDLLGGTSFTVAMDVAKLSTIEERVFDAAEATLGGDASRFTRESRISDLAVESADRERLMEAFGNEFDTAIPDEAKAKWITLADAISFFEAKQGDMDSERKERALEHAIEVLRKRVDKFGVSEPVIQPAGENRILIQIPGLTEAENESAKSQLERAAFLEFRMVHPQSAQLVRDGLGSPGYVLLNQTDTDPETGALVETPYLVKKTTERGLTGKYLVTASAVPDPITNQPEIQFRFNREGARIFGELTREHEGEQLAIVLDGELYSAPRINEPILGGVGSISGDFTVREAYELANVLENPLEAPVRIVEERRVDPSLGRDSIQSGIRAVVIGLVAVALFMLVYYMFAGGVAIVALVLNIVILLGVLCSVDATLTLPGIAGIVLTIGMAVDANVLIFERIREEFESGKSLRGALNAGYDKAFSTIFDANLTTLISSIILIYMGTGPVQGFGVTLTIGVIVSMFTALVVTRLIFEFLITRGILTKLPMLRIIRKTKIDFLSVWKPAFALSWLLVIGGTIYGFVRGGEVMGIDFAGGDSMVMGFEQRVDVDQVRSVINELNVGEPQIQYQKDLATRVETLKVTTAFESADAVFAKLNAAFPESNFERLSVDMVGPTVGHQILRSAITASLLALFGILVYVALRYEFSFAVGAVVATIHDVLMTLGIFFLSGRELSAPMVAAILTIIGFSINDTIVIFDRIREDLKLGVRGSFKSVMNMALNKTLSRTLITSGTTFLSTLALYLFGGGVINDFAFTFLVGIITGTYSSVYIASATVLWWHKGERPKMATTQVIADETVPAVTA